MEFEWDPGKDRINQRKHGLSFTDAEALFESGVDYLDIFDAKHSEFGRPIHRDRAHRTRNRGRHLHRARRGSNTNHRHSARNQTRTGSLRLAEESTSMTDIPELTDDQLERAIPARLRRRLMRGRFESGADIAALRTFVGLTQAEFARAIAISVHTLRNWEQGRRKPEGPAVALLRIAARHPRILRENLESAA
ncbi:MAG TPA: helix-turn-helix domain-containing protein [Myxococcota bacterium]|nr:helix-turn-helix domain-containing protein [Myxococcota bacterium]